MDLTGEQLLPLPRERVYDALLDPAMLKAAIPGCESVAAVEDGAYAVAVVTAIGPVKARFKGTLRLENPRRPEGYTMRFEGDGGVAGFARGSAEVRLDALAPQQTRLSYVAQAQIGGKLAAIGARLIDATAAKLSAQFFKRLAELLTTPAPAASGADNGAPAVAHAADAVHAASAANVTSAASPSAQTGASTGTAVPVAPLQPARGMVTIQMPAWTWALTVTVLAALAAWLGTR